MNDLVNVPQQGDVPVDAPQGSYVIVTQVKAHRIVFFTDDPDYEPPMDADWYYVTHYQGALPEGMTLRNCWRWRFNGGVFTDAKAAKAKTPKELLIESNRKALRKILKDKMNAVRAPLLPKGTLGTVLRVEKLAQAQAYLSDPERESDYTLLQGVAHARSISMEEAAQLVIEKAADTRRILQESELVFEQLAHAIRSAKTERALLELRTRLLDEILPSLSAKLKFKVTNTTPIDLDKPLRETHLTHEKARLKAQLRERINRARRDETSDYLGNGHLELKREQLARRILADQACEPVNGEFALLQDLADAQGLSLAAAAEAVLVRASRIDRLLTRTEADRIRISARIESIKSLRDVREVSAAVQRLKWEKPAEEGKVSTGASC